MLKTVGMADDGSPVYEPKIADFGMAADDETATTASAGTAGLSSSKEPSWAGTYLYMSQIAKGLNV